MKKGLHMTSKTRVSGFLLLAYVVLLGGYSSIMGGKVQALKIRR